MVINMMGNKQLEKIICVACSEMFVEHSKRQLIRCLFRVQSTMVCEQINNTEEHEMEDK